MESIIRINIVKFVLVFQFNILGAYKGYISYPDLIMDINILWIVSMRLHLALYILQS
jgi:hypothetical protein